MKELEGVFVCASTECFPDLPRDEILPTLVDLEFSAVEIPLNEGPTGWVRPSEINEQFDETLEAFRDTHRLSIAALDVTLDATGDAYYEQFAGCVKLAKALRVVPLIVPAAELGTPFNAEIERLRELVKIASIDGCLVAMRTQIGCMTEDPDTAVVLCDNVKGLGLALDPSHYTTGPRQGRDFGKVMPYVYHVHLRDSTKSQLQVRIGQGEIDYGRLVGQLEKVNYKRGLSVLAPPLEGIEHKAEMRKIRLLLESLL
ncbi:MAG: sugar phosphate isomerase/epimerase [Planctomycetales bacterium]|nr:sugar phosphate isomerase/epimerase [Planctomycetales bacterium]